jgi:hypothetical protein
MAGGPGDEAGDGQAYPTASSTRHIAMQHESFDIGAGHMDMPGVNAQSASTLSGNAPVIVSRAISSAWDRSAILARLILP